MENKIFYADLAGSNLPEESFRGSVQSIYSKVINLLHPQGYLISIVDKIDKMTDYGLMLGDFSSISPLLSKLTSFVWDKQIIVFPKVIVDFSFSEIWCGRVDLPLPVNPWIINQVKKIFIELTVDEGLSPIITRRKGNIYSRAADKILSKIVPEKGNRERKSIDISSLVGLGIGFTPSGDDFLVGVMLYEFISCQNIIDRKSIEQNLTKTTSGGRTLLLLSLRNSFPAYLKQFTESIILEKHQNVQYSIIKSTLIDALAHGSTSGSDSITGYLWAVEKFEKKV
jgi:Protein of unknown function (DUF2877)